jgi:hypothetical protein
MVSQVPAVATRAVVSVRRRHRTALLITTFGSHALIRLFNTVASLIQFCATVKCEVSEKSKHLTLPKAVVVIDDVTVLVLVLETEVLTDVVLEDVIDVVPVDVTVDVRVGVVVVSDVVKVVVTDDVTLDEAVDVTEVVMVV